MKSIALLIATIQFTSLGAMSSNSNVRYLPMNYVIDAHTAQCEPGSFFSFLNDNAVAMKVLWDGKKYSIEGQQPMASTRTVKVEPEKTSRQSVVRYVVIVKRRSGEIEVLSTTMEEAKDKVEESAKWWRKKFIDVDVEVAKCLIEVP